jgi:hypothetical protein
MLKYKVTPESGTTATTTSTSTNSNNKLNTKIQAIKNRKLRKKQQQPSHLKSDSLNILTTTSSSSTIPSTFLLSTISNQEEKNNKNSIITKKNECLENTQTENHNNMSNYTPTAADSNQSGSENKASKSKFFFVSFQMFFY